MRIVWYAVTYVENIVTPKLPGAIADLCRDYNVGLQRTLRDKLYAVYVYGASVFPETTAIGDVDLHVILKNRITDLEKAAVLELHERLAVSHPTLGAELDAYFLLLKDATRPDIPTHQLQTDIVDHSWALHRAHMLAGRCVVLYGPQPSDIFPVPCWSEMANALAGEFAYVEAHLAQYPDYCILNLCRLIYSYRTRDVVISKAAAGRWASEEFPQWRSVIELANRSYAGMATGQDRQIMRTNVNDLVVFAREQIDAANISNQQNQL